jgi:hypothetical protein
VCHSLGATSALSKPWCGRCHPNVEMRPVLPIMPLCAPLVSLAAIVSLIASTHSRPAWNYTHHSSGAVSQLFPDEPLVFLYAHGIACRYDETVAATDNHPRAPRWVYNPSGAGTCI